MFEIRDALAVYRRAVPGGRDVRRQPGRRRRQPAGRRPERSCRCRTGCRTSTAAAYDQPFGTRPLPHERDRRLLAARRRHRLGPRERARLPGRPRRPAQGLRRDAVPRAPAARRLRGHLRVPWISYNWGPYAVGANVMLAPGREDDGWALTPEGIAGVRRAAGAHRRAPGRGPRHHQPGQPDRPHHPARAAARAGPGGASPPESRSCSSTGSTTGSPTARPHDLNAFLLALDAGRARPLHRPRRDHQVARRVATCATPTCSAAKPVVKFMQNRASHGVIPSFHSQAVAVAAVPDGRSSRACAGIVGPTSESRKVMRGVRRREGAARTSSATATTRSSTSGRGWTAPGWPTRPRWAPYLAERFGLAVVPGVYFSDFGPRWIRFSYALPPDDRPPAPPPGCGTRSRRCDDRRSGVRGPGSGTAPGCERRSDLEPQVASPLTPRRAGGGMNAAEWPRFAEKFQLAVETALGTTSSAAPRASRSSSTCSTTTCAPVTAGRLRAGEPLVRRLPRRRARCRRGRAAAPSSRCSTG